MDNAISAGGERDETKQFALEQSSTIHSIHSLRNLQTILLSDATLGSVALPRHLVFAMAATLARARQYAVLGGAVTVMLVSLNLMAPTPSTQPRKRRARARF